jgi:hypothetical protein
LALATATATWQPESAFFAFHRLDVLFQSIRLTLRREIVEAYVRVSRVQGGAVNSANKAMATVS